MKKLFLISAALLAAISSAQSADLQRVYTKAPMAAVSSWTGFYAGLNLGYGFNDPTASFTGNDPGSSAAGGALVGPEGYPSASYDVKGILGGAQVGYNWQVAPTWLVGLEADFQGSDIKGGGGAGFITIVGVIPFSVAASQNVDWFGTVRARVGWLANDKLLAYATGGLAYGSVTDRASIIGDGLGNAGGGFSFACFGGPGAPCFQGDRTKIQAGYTVGGGLEYAMWQNVSFKAEYLYVNLGSGNATATAVAPFPPSGLSTINAHFSDLDFHVVRAGVNYHF